jgi:DNA-binding CsgD family transcriptional regulator
LANHHAAAACLKWNIKAEQGMPERGTPEGIRPKPGPDESSPAGRFIASGRSDLSEREVEIVELVATGLTNQEIAGQLMISKRTVDNHVSNIFTKTGAKNRVALLNWAMDHGKICRDGINCCVLPQPPAEDHAAGPGPANEGRR